MNGSFTIIIIIVNINNKRMIKIIEGMDCKLTFFFSSLTSPETFNNKKWINIPDRISSLKNAFLAFVIHTDLVMMMAIWVCNLHYKVRNCYASKTVSKN